MRKKAALIIATLALGTLLAGCGNSDVDSPTSSSVQKSSGSSSTAPTSTPASGNQAVDPAGAPKDVDSAVSQIKSSSQDLQGISNEAGKLNDSTDL